MENVENALWREYVGKRVKLAYIDDIGDTKLRAGILKSVEGGFLALVQDSPYPVLILPLKNVSRIEVIA